MSKEQMINEDNRGAIIPATPKVILPDPADQQNHNFGEDLDFPIIENQSARRKLIDDEETIKNNNARVSSVKKDQDKEGYEFSVGQLPAWAKKQVLNETPKADDTTQNPTGPRGRWAQRIDNQAVVIKSILDENNLQLSLSDSLERRRFTVEEQTLANQLSHLRRETIIIPNGDNKSPKNIPIIADDEANQDDDDDDDEFGNMSLAEKHSMLDNDDDTDSPIRLSGGKVTMTRGSDTFSPMGQLRQSLSVESDNEADDEEQKEDILYLPTEEGSESSDAMASSFHVFEGDTASYKDENTDHGSNESDTESEPSAPNTPHVPLSEGDAEAGFMKNNFDNLGNSPLLTESFDSTIESIEKRFAFNEDPSQLSLLNSRHSISSRFLSRSQQQHLRNLALQNSMQKTQGNISHAASLQQKKEEILRAVDQTRQRLQALRNAGGGGHAVGAAAAGCTNEGQPADVIPEKGPPASPPVRRRRMPETPSVPPNTRLSTPAASQEQPFSETGGGGSSRGRMSLGGPDTDPPSRGRPSLGGDRSRPRKSADDKSSGAIEPSLGSGSKKWKSLFDIGGNVISRSATQSPATVKLVNRRSKTPTPRSKTPTPLSPLPPRSAEPERALSPFKYEKKIQPLKLPKPKGHHVDAVCTPPRSPRSPRSPKCGPVSPRFAPSSAPVSHGHWGNHVKFQAPEHSLCPPKVTRSGGGRMSTDFPPPSRSKSDYNLTSGSDESAPSSPSKRAGASRTTFAKTYQRGTQSSIAKTQESSNTLPSNKRNLKGRGKINPALKNKFKSTPDLANLDDEEDDFVSLQKLPSKTTEDLPSKDDAKAKKYSRRSMPATKLDRQDPFGLNQPPDRNSVVAGVVPKPSLSAKSSTGSVSSDTSDPDRLAMPPPPSTKVPALKQETFPKKAASKPSSQTNLTLAEAKAILLGKSSSNVITSGSGSGADSGPGSSNSSTSGKLDNAAEFTANGNAPQVKANPASNVRTVSPAPVQSTYGKWSQSSNEELDEMPVKERSRRIPFRQPISQGEGDDPREGSPEPEPRRRPAFPTSTSTGALKTMKVETMPEKQAGRPKVSTPDSEVEADSPGSSYAGSDTEPSVVTPKAVKSPTRSRMLPSTTQRERGRLGEVDISSVQSSPGRPSSPVKTFTLPRETRSNSAADVLHVSASESRLSYGSLDRKGRLLGHAEARNNGSMLSPKSDSGSDNSVDILGNFVKKSGSSGNVDRDSFSPPRRDPVEKSSAVSDKEKPQQTVKSRISSWESASRSPSQSPAPIRRQSTSPTKVIGKPKTPEGTPPPRPNNTPLPPPPNVTSPRSTPEVSPRSGYEKDSQPTTPTSSTRLVPKQKDSTGLVITPTRTRMEYNFESDSATNKEPVKTFTLTKPKELPRIPENDVNGASPAVPGHAMNATFILTPRGTPVTGPDPSGTPLFGIASLRAAARTAAELKQKQQQARVTESRELEQAAQPDVPTAEGEGDADEIKRPDKSRRYPPTSLTASPPQQIKTIQLSEPKSPESVSASALSTSTTENENRREATSPPRSSLRLPLADQATASASQDRATSDEKQCEELIRNLQSTVNQAVAFSQRVDGSLQARVRQALQEVHKSLERSLPSDSVAAQAKAAQTPTTPDDETVELLRMIKASSDKLLNKFGPV